MGDNRKLAFYWASSCGGCEIAVANLHELFLELTRVFDLFFCPAFVDTKKADVAALPDDALSLTLFDGAVRTDENLEMAELLRRKSEVLVAFGACAATGGVPALSNLSTREDHLRTIFGDTADGHALPREETRVPEGVLRLPRFHGRVRSLADVVPGDTLEVLADCDTFENDVHQWCKTMKKVLVVLKDEPPKGKKCVVRI